MSPALVEVSKRLRLSTALERLPANPTQELLEDARFEWLLELFCHVSNGRCGPPPRCSLKECRRIGACRLEQLTPWTPLPKRNFGFGNDDYAKDDFRRYLEAAYLHANQAGQSPARKDK